MPRSNLHGEVQFRKLVHAQDRGACQIAGWYTAAKVEEIIASRVERLNRYYREYAAFVLDPVLELAAGRCQLSMVLKEHFGSQRVIATDISRQALQTAPLFHGKLKFSAPIPERIQCNIENLPFCDSSFRHVAVWAALHHFDSPQKAIAEVERVLCDQGTFFVGGEPIKPILNIPFLSLKQEDLEVPSFLLRVAWKFRIAQFVSKIFTREEEFGVIENSFRLRQYETFFQNFDRVAWHEIPATESSFLEKLFSRKTRSRIYGGTLEHALLQIHKRDTQQSELNFICPNCKPTTLLMGTEFGFECRNCRKRYPVKEGILILLSDKDEQAIGNRE